MVSMPERRAVKSAKGAESREAAGFLEFLVAEGRLDRAGVDRIERLGQASSEPLSRLLGRLGLVADEDLATLLSTYLKLPVVRAEDFPKHPVLADRIGVQFLRQHRVLPLADSKAALRLAMADPLDRYALEAIRLLIGKPVEPAIAEPAAIERALDRLYEEGGGRVDRILAELGPYAAVPEAADAERLSNLASEAPVVRLVASLIEEAIAARASDIHIEPFEHQLVVRYRIDGMLREVEILRTSLQAALVSRIKILARLNIAERRLPQDGRCQVTVGGRDIDVRVSSVPTLYGESVVLRLLDQARAPLRFDLLGFAPDTLARLLDLLERPHGIVLVTGPTGSGKTTTLYAALSHLNSPERKILTVEDPIEYQLTRINQIQVAPKIDLTFANILRSMLRQDPDIMMVGEIRDRESAELAVQAALTGHLILSTVHTNNAAGAVTRLVDMGIERFLLSSALTAILSQRLVRTPCARCREAYVPAPEAAAALGLERLAEGREAVLQRAVGCEACASTGYAGRTSIAELLPISEAIRRAILEGADAPALERLAIGEGMRTMAEDGLKKALAGLTTAEEVVRVTSAV